MQLAEVVPWGRNAAEYRRMFDLTTDDLDGRILGCGDGPAGFNAEMTAAGHDVVSVDPLYAFQSEEIRARIDATYATVVDQVKANPGRYVWREFADPDALAAARMAAMARFLQDFPQGKRAGRYRAASLPDLPFSAGSFDLALVSHLLFLYTDQLDAAFHVAAVQELLRVAQEVRIFPLLSLAGRFSPHVTVVEDWCADNGVTAEIRTVPYEFQVGATEMLVIAHP